MNVMHFLRRMRGEQRPANTHGVRRWLVGTAGWGAPYASVLALLASAGCSDPSPVGNSESSPPTPIASAALESAEGEIFGRTYEAMVHIASVGLEITLTPDAETMLRLHPVNKDPVVPQTTGVLSVPNGKNGDFGWWDPETDDVPCAPSPPEADYLVVGPGSPEVHGGGDAQERHCVVPGRYLLSIPRPGVDATLEIDYLALKQAAPLLVTGPAGQTEPGRVLRDDFEPGSYEDRIADVILDIDAAGDQNLAEYPALVIDAVPPASVAVASMTYSATPSGDHSSTFRFAAGFGGSAWVGSDGRRFHVVRLFFDLSDMAKRSGFYTAGPDLLLRTWSYPSPPAGYASCRIQVGLEILRPDEVLSASHTLDPDPSELHVYELTVTGGPGAVAGGPCHALVPETNELTVSGTGSGSGTVTSAGSVTPAIACTITAGVAFGTCSASYPTSTSVTLQATGTTGSSFAGWSGDCTGATCSVSMAGPRAVTANFASAPQACHWQPDGYVEILPGATRTFSPNQGGCSGHTVTILPAGAAYGFSTGSGCTLKTITTSSLGSFKIRGCTGPNAGRAVVKDPAGNPIQTIWFVDAP